MTAANPLLALWEKSKSDVLGMLDVVEGAAAVGVMDGLSSEDPLRNEAAGAAHKLVGIGSFGFPTVGPSMITAEQLLRDGMTLDGDRALKLAESVVAVRAELERGPGGSASRSERIERAAPSQRVVDVAVVEDDSTLMGLLRHALKEHGFFITEFASGTAAASALLGPAPSVVPRVVLLDVDLPGRSGLSLLREFHGAGMTSTIKVIMMTARSNIKDVSQAGRLGAHGYLTKPLNIRELIDVVGSAVSRR